MYAVVAPELKGIYENYSDIERILALYPYAKYRKFQSEDECWEFLARHSNSHSLEEVSNFGDTFSHRVIMEYFIRDSSVYYNFHTQRIGTLHLVSDTAIIENRVGLVKALLPNVLLDNNTIPSHIIAIYRGLDLLGNFMDVEIIVPDHSILYAIHSYSGSSRIVRRLKTLIDHRLGKVSLTLRR